MGRRLNQLGVYSLASVICVIFSAPDQLNASSWQSPPRSAVINSRSYSAQTAEQPPAAQPKTGLAGRVRSAARGIAERARGDSVRPTSVQTSSTKLVAHTTAGPGTFTDTTTLDFQAGTTGCVIVTHIGDGEVILAPTLSEDFSAYPPSWPNGVPYDPFNVGFANVSGGQLNVEGEITGPGCTLPLGCFAAGRTLEFVASFTGPHQAVGFGTTKLDDPASNVPTPYAVFWTDENGALFARSNDGSGDLSTPVPFPNPEQPHLYRIEWIAGSPSHVDFYINDPDFLVTTSTFSTLQTMRPIASDHDVDGLILAVDFMRMSPYISPCTFTSQVFDAGGPVLFATITADKKLPPGTTLTLCVKTGNLASDLASAPCTAEPVIDRVGRFVQYVASLTSPAQLRTPELRSVTISYGDVCPATLSCDDGNPCTVDTCNTSTGHCDHTNVVCAAPDSCHQAGTCQPATGICSFATQPNGTACNDGNACTLNDTCQAGVCQSGAPKQCTASDQCHTAGSCNPATGVCSNPAKANGTACSDGNACTQNDTCQSGVCAGTAITCTASDQCHTAGSCNPATGVCSNPAKANGTACNDNDACTTGDSCQSGVCKGTNTCSRVKVTGSGCVPTPSVPPGKGQFAFNAGRKPNSGKSQGHFTYFDKGSGIKVDGKVDTFTLTSSNTATFSGSCGSTCRFTVDVVDNGDSGKDDMIRVRITGNGSKNTDTGLKKLCGGNIMFHPGGKHFDHDDDHDGHENDDD